jgi:hypothetical protein
MFPKSIKLNYDNAKMINADESEVRPLPVKIHLRGANQIISTVEVDHEFKQLKLRSDYDALYDIELDITVKGLDGLVNTVRFVESK